MRKKHSLFFWLFMCFFVYVLFTWFIPLLDISSGQTAGVNPIGLFGLLYFPVNSVVSTIMIGLVFLAIGGFYGVMSKTGVYTNIVDNTVKGLKGKENLFLILTSVTLTIVNAVVGLPFAYMIIVPFLAAVILRLGYNKLTALTVTIGSVLVGNLGSIFGTQVVGYISNAFSLTVSTNIIWRIVMLIFATALFVCFVMKTAKLENVKATKKTTKSTKSTKTTKAETKKEEVVEEKEEILFLNSDVKAKKSSTPMIIIASLLIVFTIISMFNWNFFGISIFDSIFELISKPSLSNFGAEIEAGSFLSNYETVPIVTAIFGVLSSFGNWYLIEMICLLVIASMIVAWIYNMKFVEVFDGFIDGAKQMIKPAIYVSLTNLILVPALSYYGKYSYYFIADKLLGNGFNALTTFISSLIGSFLYNDIYYFAQELNVIYSALQYGSEYYPIVTFIAQAIHGLTMFVLPMSVVLVAGLTMMNVSYKDWMKHIWKFLLELFVIVMVLIIVYSIGLNVIF